MNKFAHSPLCRCSPCREAAFLRRQHDERVKILRAYRRRGRRPMSPDGAFILL